MIKKFKYSSLATSLFVAGISANAMADGQVITPSSSTEVVAPGGAISIDLNYSTDPAGLSSRGLNFGVFYNSTMFSSFDVTNVFQENEQSTTIAPVQDDVNDIDGDPKTDKYIQIGWFDFSGAWPGADSVVLGQVNGTVSSGFSGQSSVNFALISPTFQFDSFTGTSISVQEDMAPVFTPIEDIVMEATGQTTTVTLTPPTVTDDVDGALTATTDSTDSFGLGMHTVVWSATDSKNQTSTYEQKVTIKDETAPSFDSLPDDITVYTVSDAATVTFPAVTATDANGVDPSVDVMRDTDATSFAVGMHDVTWTATDDSGNKVEHVQKVTVIFDTAPVLPEALDDLTFEATGQTTAVSLPMVKADDERDGEIMAVASPAGPFQLGETMITWTATDVSGNQDTVMQKVIIEDTTAPVIAPVADFSVFNPNIDGSVAVTMNQIPSAVANDIVDGTITAVSDFQAGDYSDGTYTITWNASDLAGNAAQPVSATMTVFSDNVAPVVVAPTDITMEATATKTPVELGTATATDQARSSDTPMAIDGVMADMMGPFDVGVHTITWSVMDAAGNKGMDTQTVTITDTTAPDLTVPAALTLNTRSKTGEPKMRQEIYDFLMAASAVDLVDGMTDVTNNAPDQFPGGDTVVTFTTTDSRGNDVSKNVTVSIVIDDDAEGPTFGALDNITKEATGMMTPVELVWPTVTDNFSEDNEKITLTVDEKEAYPVGTTTLTWTATDVAGNVTTLNQDIVITDTTLPVFAEVADKTIDATGKFTNISMLYKDEMVTDIVDGYVMPMVSSEDVLPSGNHKVMLKATDTAGNSAMLETMLGINPAVAMPPTLFVEPGATSKVEVNLLGHAAMYPVTLKFMLEGASEDMAEVVIDEGTMGYLMVTAPADATDGTMIKAKLSEATNASVVDMPETMLEVKTTNYAPTVSIVAKQNDMPITVVDTAAGDVTLMAMVEDVNVNDQHSIMWSINGSDLTDQTATVTVPVSTFDTTGSYTIEVNVAETNTTEQNTTSDSVVISKPDALPTLGATDSDGDGVSDADEGLTDTDGDGIPDYLDDDDDTTTLPIAGDDEPMQTQPGLTLEIGNSTAASDQGLSADAGISRSELAAVLGDNRASDDLLYNGISEVINFKVSGLIEAGQSVPVVIPLPMGVTIPEAAEYRKFIDGQWQEYVADAKNTISSAPLNSDGLCPGVNSADYQTGLNIGDSCILLEIEDGGPYDFDGEKNGSVEDPGQISVRKPNTAPIPMLEASSGGFANEGTTVTLDATGSQDRELDDLTYTFTQLTGPTVDLVPAGDGMVTFTAPDVLADTEMSFRVEVADYEFTETSEVDVYVWFVNQLPTLSVTSSASTAAAGDAVRLEATAADADGHDLTYTWRQVGGVNTVATVNGSSMSAVAPSILVDSTVTFEVTVSDGYDSVSTTVSFDVMARDNTSGGSTGGIWMLMLGMAGAVRRFFKK